MQVHRESERSSRGETEHAMGWNSGTTLFVAAGWRARMDGFIACLDHVTWFLHPAPASRSSSRLLPISAGLLTGLLGSVLAAPAVRAADPPGTTPAPLAAEPPAEPSTTETQQEPTPWAGTVELYGFAPLRTTGTTTVKGFNTDLDLDLGQVLRPLTGVAYIRGSVEYGRIGLLADISYVSVKGQDGKVLEIKTDSIEGPLGKRTLTLTSDSQPSLDAKVGNIQGIYDLALRYRFGDRESAVAKAGSFTVIPYAGVRFVNMQYDLALQGQASKLTLKFKGPDLEGSRTLQELNLQQQQSFGGTVAQPLLGTQAMVFLSPRLRLFARADMGGFGVNNADDYSWNTQVGLGYAIGNSTQLNLSWRYLHLSGSNDQIPENAYNIDQNGVEIGLKFFF